jgi:uncharacterized protein YkwD
MPPSDLLRAVLATRIAFAVSGCIGPSAEAPATPTFYQRLDQGATLDPVAAQGMINAWRANNSLEPLAVDADLSAEAQRRAAAVAKTDRSSWGETPDPGRSGGGGSGFRAERVSAGYRTLAEAFSGWRDSPKHNSALLAPQAKRLGIAAVDQPGSKYGVYWAFVVAGP